MGKKKAAAEPEKVNTVEKRIKLSDKQYSLLASAIKARNETLKAFEDATRSLNTVSTLIMDAYKLDESLQPQLDEQTHELFYTVPEAPTEGAAA